MPDSPQYKDTGVDSFWGNYLFEVVVPKDHFLRALKGLFDWQELGRNLILLYEGKGVLGRPPYDPVLLFKMFLLSYLYNLSARDTEQFVRENIPARFSLNLALDQPVPDHSTISLFKERLLAQASAQRERLGHIQLGVASTPRRMCPRPRTRSARNAGGLPGIRRPGWVHKGTGG